MSAIDRALHQLLLGNPNLVWQQAKVETVPGYRYPDIVVGPRDADRTKTVLPDPVVLLEVLSPSTAHVDFGRKLAEYGQLASVRHYVLIESLRVATRVLIRMPTGGWDETILDASGTLDLAAIGVGISLSAFYEDVRF